MRKYYRNEGRNCRVVILSVVLVVLPKERGWLVGTNTIEIDFNALEIDTGYRLIDELV